MNSGIVMTPLLAWRKAMTAFFSISPQPESGSPSPKTKEKMALCRGRFSRRRSPRAGAVGGVAEELGVEPDADDGVEDPPREPQPA